MTKNSMSHLVGRQLPRVVLPATFGGGCALDDLSAEPTVIFFYPKTGDPNSPDSAAWAAIPGARGCTAEACSFRDLRDEFRKLNWDVVGCSAQTTEYQSEVATRLHLSYPLLSDPSLVLADALGLPTFTFEGIRLYRRMTLLLRGGMVVSAVDPGDHSAGHVEEVLDVARSLVTEA